MEHGRMVPSCSVTSGRTTYLAVLIECISRTWRPVAQYNWIEVTYLPHPDPGKRTARKIAQQKSLSGFTKGLYIYSAALTGNPTSTWIRIALDLQHTIEERRARTYDNIEELEQLRRTNERINNVHSYWRWWCGEWIGYQNCSWCQTA